jgi:diadenosine tetraphosphate (Ap4A) HIT family hydrolase
VGVQAGVSAGESCDVCERNTRSERGENPFTVARTTTGYVNLADVQYHAGYTIFCAKRCVNELHELGAGERDAYLREMAAVAEAVFRAFGPRKLNYELLGNGVPHLHWHLFPRYAGDPHPSGPVWEDPGFGNALAHGAPPTPEQLTGMRGSLLTALENADLRIERRFP